MRSGVGAGWGDREEVGEGVGGARRGRCGVG